MPAPTGLDSSSGRASRTRPGGGLAALPFYLGGFLGPFGSLIVVPMFPELRDRFTTDSETISWGFSAYFIPMALLLLVSGTIGERYGRRLVLQLSFGAYAVASLVVALAPSLAWFLAARAVQGAGNAFFTPLLVAALADVTPAHQLGRRVGVYGSFQAIGGGLSPFAGGWAAALDWRLAFYATAAVSLVLIFFTPPGGRRAGADRPPIRPLLSRPLIALGVASFTAAAGPLGAAVLVGFKARDVLDMDPRTTGLLLAGGSVGAALLTPPFGRVLDRFGGRLCGVGSGLALSLVVAALGWTTTVAGTALLFAAAGSIFGFVIVVLQKAGASIVPENRGGALSAIMSFRFGGHAVGPLLWVPVFSRSEPLAFVGSAALGLVAIAAILVALTSDD